jgi:drug/metabolite transporter (DMT)-like permease
VIFKVFKKYDINTFQAIVFNYFTAFTCGYLTSPEPWENISGNLSSWWLYAIVSSILFISLFFIMGKSSQENGVASTSVAVKMSMAISILAFIYFYNETISWMKIVGVCFAFIGVYLVSHQKESTKNKAAWMLLVLFIGSGMLDFLLNRVQDITFEYYLSSMFTAFGFLFAGTIGLIFLSIQIIRKKTKIEFKNVLAGIILGIPNYFSIYMLISSYEILEWQDSTILAVMNVSVVIISNIIGFSVFKEKLNVFKIIGLSSAIAAIILLVFAN